MRKILISIVALALMVTLAACGNKQDKENDPVENEGQSEAETLPISDEEKLDSGDIVADINGVELSGDDYNVIYTQAKIQLSQLGQDIEDVDMIKDFTINTLVDQELLRQDAEEKGISVAEDEVDTEYNTLREENEEGLNAFLDEYGLEEGAFKEQMSFTLVYDKYVESEIDTNVSDEELEQTYNQLAEESEEESDGENEFPEFDEVKDQLRGELEAQKEQEELNSIVEDLKENASIEMKI